MIISVPTAQLQIKGMPLGITVPAINDAPRYCLFEDNDFVNNIVYVDFARGPPVAA